MPIAPGTIPAEVAVMDLTYRRGRTPWAQACRARGLRAEDGLPMLIEQGALAFERWFGLAPDREAMWASVRR
jgi:shikimate dehydrogenase